MKFSLSPRRNVSHDLNIKDQNENLFSNLTQSNLNIATLILKIHRISIDSDIFIVITREIKNHK